MLAIQIRAYALLTAILLLVDAFAYHGAYRQEVGGRVMRVLSAISPAHWSAGSGRDWRNPGRRRN
jgi:hypothetical protein